MKAKQQKIFDSILALVPREGWTSTAFIQGIKKAKATSAEAHAFFPCGMEDVIVAFHHMVDEAMHVRIKAKRNFSSMRVRDKITFAVRVRLETTYSYPEAMRRLWMWSLLPRNIRAATRHLWQVADTIWISAGDTATDYNYYTKRILLIAVMKSTMSFWLNDNSVGKSDSWAFLDRRIGDIMTLGKGIGIAKTIGVADIVSFVRSRFVA